MQTFKELSNQASQARKASNFEQALPLYANLWKNHQDHLNEWDGWGYAQCLYKTKQYSQSLDICRAVYLQYRDFPNIRNLYAWNIYQLEIKPENPGSKFNKAVDAILTLGSQEEEYSPYTLTVFKALKVAKENAQTPYERILYLTDQLDPNKLDDKPNSFINNKGKQQTFASDLERYLTYRSKALYELGQWQDSIACCKQALDRFNKLHNNNDIWFKRRIAQCQLQLKQPELALEKLKNILPKKRDWYIQHEIAEILYQMQQYDEALTYAIQAALNNGDYDKKIKLYALIADILTAKGEPESALYQQQLVYTIRRENNWNIPEELEQILQQANIEIDNLPTAKEQLKKLTKAWGAIQDSLQPSYNGTIKTILSNGKAGFIRAENGKEYYFSLQNVKGNKQACQEGMSVNFKLEEGYDRKKGKATLNAVNIRLQQQPATTTCNNRKPYIT